MNDQKTSSMLQRLPVILAVTAASYGLQVPPQALRPTASASSTQTLDPAASGRTAPVRAAASQANGRQMT